MPMVFVALLASSASGVLNKKIVNSQILNHHERSHLPDEDRLASIR